MVPVSRASRATGKLLTSTAPAPDPISTTPQPDQDPCNIPPARDGAATKPQSAPPSPSTNTHQRHGDRGSGSDADDDAGDDRQRRGWPPPLRFIRFNDLVAAGVVRNWVTLGRLIKDEGFPAGLLLGPNMRAWEVDKVEAWIAGRPTATRIPANVLKARERKRAKS